MASESKLLQYAKHLVELIDLDELEALAIYLVSLVLPEASISPTDKRKGFALLW